MFRLLPALALLLPLLPTFVSAQCAACDSYTAALKSCQTASANVTEVGSPMDSTTLYCMCTSKTNVTDLNACLACDESNLSSSLNIAVLNAWTTTCRADDQFGDQQAANCWESQPSNILPCVSNTGGSGSAGSDTDSGSDVATTSASAGATSSPSSPSSTKSSTTTAKSDAMRSWEMPVLLSFLVIGLGTVIEL